MRPRCSRSSRDSTMRGRSAAYIDLDYYDALLALGTGRPNNARRALDRSQREGARTRRRPDAISSSRAAPKRKRCSGVSIRRRRSCGTAMSMFERYRAYA